MKKFISFVTSLTVAASAVAPALTSAASEFLVYADYLAGKSVIKSTDEAGYRLGDKITRAEMAKVAANLAKLELQACNGKVFGDVTEKMGDLCQYIEAMASAGYVAKNANFRPMDLVTRAEMVKMLLKAKGMNPTDEDMGFTDIANIGDLAGYVNAAAKEGVISKNANFRPNDTASRGEVFKVAAKANGYQEEDDLGLDDIFGTGTTTTPTNSGTVVLPTGGALKVTLSPATPAAQKVPGNLASLEVLKVDLTAGSADVAVNGLSLKRFGYSNSDLSNNQDVAVFGAAGRLSSWVNVKDTTDKDISFTKTFVVKAGATETVTLVVTVPAVATGAGINGQTFGFELTKVASNSSSATLAAIKSATFEVAAVNAAQSITLKNLSAGVDPKIGTTQAELFTFDIQNSDNDYDSTLKAITFTTTGSTINELTDLANFSLVADGKVVATLAKMTDSKYLTFSLVDGFAVTKSKTRSFSVKADILSADNADKIGFYVKAASDVRIIDGKYGYPVNPTIPTNDAVVSVKGGKVTLTRTDATTKDLLSDKDNVVLGSFVIANAASSNLLLKKLTVAYTTTGTGIYNIFDADSIQAVINGSTYDLSTTNLTSGTLTSDDDIDVAVGKSLTVTLIGDTVNNNTASWANNSITLTLNKPSIQEAQSEIDVLASDITATNSLTFAKLSTITSSASVTNVALSNKDVVRGTTAVDMAKFKVRAGSASKVLIKKVYLNGAVTVGTGSTTLNTSEVLSNATLVVAGKTYNATLSTNAVKFDLDTAIEVAASSEVEFLVQGNIDAAIESTELAKTLKVKLSGASFDADDTDGDTVTLDHSVIAGRFATIISTGELATAEYKTTYDANKYDKNIIAGSTATVASYALASKNEGVKADKVTVTFSGNVQSTVSDVKVYFGDVLVANNPEWTVGGTVATFNKDYVTAFTVPSTETALRIDVVTKNIGYAFSEVGAQLDNLAVTNVTLGELTGESSQETIADKAIATTSMIFAVVPVRLSAVSLETSALGQSLATKLSNGSNNAAILKVTADQWSNTKGDTNAKLETILSQVKFNVKASSGTTATYTLEKIGGANGTVAGVVSGGTVTFTGLGASDKLVKAGETVYFVVKAEVTKGGAGDTDDYLRLSMDNLATGAVVYASDEAGAATISALRLGATTKLDGTQISE